ncbi:MAG: hypothetical protein HC837_08815 [Chloroflexaceae bacterium]|nr:hypothetical protein [Chloroflexaceae bacterium]
MKAGIGYGNANEAERLGQQVADQAMQQGNIATPGLVLAFCGGQVDAGAFYQGIRSIVGANVPIIGGSAIGVITNDDLSYDGCPAGLPSFSWMIAGSG